MVGDIASAQQEVRVEDTARSAAGAFAREERDAATAVAAVAVFKPLATTERVTAEGAGLSHNRLYRRREHSESAAGWKARGSSSSGAPSGRSRDGQKDTSDSSSRTRMGAVTAASAATMTTAAAPLGSLPLENEAADANGSEAS